MPLPLILGGLALIAGAFGVKKGVDAHSDNKEAGSLRQKAKREFDKAKSKLNEAREACNSDLETLGQCRLELQKQSLGRFESLFREFGNTVFLKQADLEQAGFSEERLQKIRELSTTAGEVLGAGVATLGSGVLVGVGSYGAATMLATASTGTAISTLSGVAATNATVAWFGGGALAAGGSGIAAGTAVLGGIVAGPVLAVGGMLMAAKARENLANAKRSLAEAEKEAGEMNAARAVVEAIAAVARQFQEVSMRMDHRFTVILDDLETVIERKRRLWRWLPWKRPINFKRLSESDQRLGHVAYLFAQTFQAVLVEPLLTKEGALSEMVEPVLANGLDLIGQNDDAPGVAGKVPLLEQREDDGA